MGRHPAPLCGLSAGIISLGFSSKLCDKSATALLPSPDANDHRFRSALVSLAFITNIFATSCQLINELSLHLHLATKSVRFMLRSLLFEALDLQRIIREGSE